MAEETQAKAPYQASLSHPWLPRRDKESAHKDDVVLEYVMHLAQPLPLSFRTLRVIRDMNETFQGSAGDKPVHTRVAASKGLAQGQAASARSRDSRHRASLLLNHARWWPPPIIITLLLQRDKVLSLLPTARAEHEKREVQPVQRRNLFCFRVDNKNISILHFTP